MIRGTSGVVVESGVKSVVLIVTTVGVEDIKGVRGVAKGKGCIERSC
jgi:hypothetical protein